MSIVSVFAAIKSAFDSSPLVQITGGLFYGRVFDTETPPPYVTYTLINGLTDNDMTERLEDMIVQFSVWSAKRSPTEVLGVAEALWAVFDDAVLTAEGYALIRIDRVSYNLIPDLDTEGWQMQTDYRILLQEL